mgnify:CR=1 FL=1
MRHIEIEVWKLRRRLAIFGHGGFFQEKQQSKHGRPVCLSVKTLNGKRDCDDSVMFIGWRLGSRGKRTLWSCSRIADNIGMLWEGKLRAFGPARDVLASTDPAVRQFFDRRSEGPIRVA